MKKVFVEHPLALPGSAKNKYIYIYIYKLEDMACYAHILLAPVEGFGLWPRLFFPFGQKKSLFSCFGPFLVASSK